MKTRRLFRNDSVEDLFTKDNFIIFGVVFGACALALYSFTAFLLAAALTVALVLHQEQIKNDNSIQSLFGL